MRNQTRNRKKGSAIIEAALVLPIILILLIGIVEFARILMIQQTITNAAREGARIGAIQLDNTQSLSSADLIAKDYLLKCGMNLENADVVPLLTTIGGVEGVQVSIQYTYSSNLRAFIPGLNESIALNSRVVMRREA